MSETKNLWGGRFEGQADPSIERFNRSFGFDHRLFEADVRASLAHCEALRGAGVLTREEAERVAGGLREMLGRAAAEGAGYFDDPKAEDVHSFIEARLIESVGEAGRKLHTGRSRNDQVATALRLWLREEVDRLIGALRGAQGALLDLAETHAAAVLPGYTHLQRAQPVYLAHHLLLIPTSSRYWPWSAAPARRSA